MHKMKKIMHKHERKSESAAGGGIVLYSPGKDQTAQDKKQYRSRQSPEKEKRGQPVQKKQAGKVCDNKNREYKSTEPLHPFSVNQLRHIVKIPDSRRNFCNSPVGDQPEAKQMGEQKKAVGQKDAA